MSVHRFLCAAALPLLMAACVARQASPEPARPVEATAAQRVTLEGLLPERHKLGPSIEVNGAVIHAIVAPGAPAETEYLTLDEAMKAQVCTVRETGEDGESGDVNTLLVSNTGDRPIFLMAGDLVLGGKQDRILAESLVVAPNTRDLPVPVFCVEQGRWSLQAADSERVKAGEFYNVAERGQADFSVKRAALASRDQGEVWDSVGGFTTTLGVSTPPTGTFRAVYEDEKTAEKLEKAYARAASLAGEGVVGYAVVHDGEPVAMDVFDSAGLCAKVSEKLLRSYLITAIAGGYDLPPERKLLRRIEGVVVTLNWQEMPLREAADQLSRALGVAIEVEEGVDGTASVELANVTGHTAVLELARAVNARVHTGADGATVVFGNLSGDIILHDQDPNSPPTNFRRNIGSGFEPLTDEEQLNTLHLPRRARRLPQAGSLDTTEAPTVSPHEVAPNERTRTIREAEGEALRYQCEDKATGRTVQRSFLRR
jgi:hypothetical protein